MPTFKVYLTITLEAEDVRAAVRESFKAIEVLPAALAATVNEVQEL